MTPLAAELVRRIRADGPMTVADYMAECLLHPKYGYYSTRDPFGEAGDFITAPDISQMFGELLGLCLAQAWHDQGAPASFTLAELGPGRGTLMADALRATRDVPGFHVAAQVVLVEASPVLRRIQAQALQHHPGVAWADSVDALPDAPLFVLANEFFDALPVRQYERGPLGWHEALVGVDAAGLVLGRSGPLPVPDARFDADSPGTVIEICPQMTAIAGSLGQRLTSHGGAALVIDYGGWRSKGDTLQALRRHRPEHVLDHPGDADLTAHVDFESLALAMGTPRSGLTDQGRLLQRLGIEHRAARLATGLQGERLKNHRAALHRLTHPAEMGSLFKAIAFHTPGSPPPPGFDPDPDA